MLASRWYTRGFVSLVVKSSRAAMAMQLCIRKIDIDLLGLACIIHIIDFSIMLKINQCFKYVFPLSHDWKFWKFQLARLVTMQLYFCQEPATHLSVYLVLASFQSHRHFKLKKRYEEEDKWVNILWGLHFF